MNRKGNKDVTGQAGLCQKTQSAPDGTVLSVTRKDAGLDYISFKAWKLQPGQTVEATNMVTGAARATINGLPVLLLPGDIFANRIPHPVLQQLEYPGSRDVSVNDTFRPVSKYWDRFNRPEQVLSVKKNTAFPVFTSGVRGSAPEAAFPYQASSGLCCCRRSVWLVVVLYRPKRCMKQPDSSDCTSLPLFKNLHPFEARLVHAPDILILG